MLKGRIEKTKYSVTQEREEVSVYLKCKEQA